MPRPWVWLVAVLSALTLTDAGCGLADRVGVAGAAPSCRSLERLALVAQSVPTASTLPCVNALPTGWRSGTARSSNGRTTFSLISDRAPGHPVRVSLSAGCDPGSATVTTPRGPGVRTYIELRSISPRYAGTLLDVFAGGCVSYDFDFQRGPHIALTEDFEAAIGLVPRSIVAADIHRRLGTRLDP